MSYIWPIRKCKLRVLYVAHSNVGVTKGRSRDGAGPGGRSFRIMGNGSMTTGVYDIVTISITGTLVTQGCVRQHQGTQGQDGNTEPAEYGVSHGDVEFGSVSQVAVLFPSITPSTPPLLQCPHRRRIRRPSLLACPLLRLLALARQSSLVLQRSFRSAGPARWQLQ